MVSLSVDLDSSRLGDEGAGELAELCRSAHLRDLRLSLRDNGFTDASGAALGALLKRPSLKSLRFNLRDNEVSDISAEEFASLGTDVTLECLDFDLTDNRIGDGMAQSLTAAISQAHTVSEVRLGLEMGLVGDVGALALSTLLYIPRLKSFDLNLRGNQVGLAGIRALTDGAGSGNLVDQARKVLVWPG